MSGKYQIYVDKKDTKIPWIGQIPVDWYLSKIKYLTKCLDGSRIPLNAEERGAMQGNIPYWGANNIVDFVNEYLFDEELILLGEDGAPFFDPDKDVAFNVSGKIWPNNHVHVLRPYQSKTNPIFLKYAINSSDFHLYISGSTRDKLNQSDMGDIYIRQCNYQLQTQIANFLDHETARIDTLIERQKKLIGLLKEKRQALISHTVTKGLNPDVPMKDSGIEWLGEVPEHWIVSRLKFNIDLQTGIAKGKDLSNRKSIEVPMLRVANVQDGYIDLSDVHNISIEPDQLQRYLLKPGDILMNEGGDNDKLGRGAIWDGKILECIHQNHVFAIRSIDIEPEWIDMLTRSEYAKSYFFQYSKQSTNLASISSSNLKEIPILIPPLEERKHILNHIEVHINKIDSILKKSDKSISLLQEKRTALISAAVTGKIDVRNWKKPEGEA